LIEKHDQLVVYASRLLNNVERNYNITKCETLAMVFDFHKFKHYFLGNRFVFYIDHMAFVYLINKPRVSGRIARWLLLFLEYEFIVVYKLGRTHVVANAQFKFLDTMELTRVFDQTTNALLFVLHPV
jgi:hypothetical protein